MKRNGSLLSLVSRTANQYLREALTGGPAKATAIGWSRMQIIVEERVNIPGLSCNLFPVVNIELAAALQYGRATLNMAALTLHMALPNCEWSTYFVYGRLNFA